ncbi:hypothetical protein [Segatella copri]|uniref:hypothetical protein n=1 Tax=Segatella copri TaxID=165179 RepID=UPI0011C3D9F6|nr:hypothetical protein [Segatella copri]
MYTFARKRMQQNTDMVQSATPNGSVSESRRLDKSTDTTPLAYVVESLTLSSRLRNPVQPYP